MLVFGHLGLGSRLSRALTKHVSVHPLWIGTLLPDLIDKPLYYGLSWTLDLRADQLPVIHGTRSMGHTALFCACFFILALLRKSPALLSLSLGILSHLALDAVSDGFLNPQTSFNLLTLPLLWPLVPHEFPTALTVSLEHHWRQSMAPGLLLSEALGLILFLIDFPRKKRESTISMPQTESSLKKSKEDQSSSG